MALLGIIVVLGGVVAYIVLGERAEITETASDEVEVVLGNTNTAPVKDIVEVELDDEDVEELAETEEATEESEEEDEEETTEETADEEEETVEETVGAIEPSVDWDTAAEYENEETGEKYRVRADSEASLSSDTENRYPAIVEYQSEEGAGYSTIHEFAFPESGATFSFEETATSFMTLSQRSAQGTQYYLVGTADQNVKALDENTGYYYVYGGLGSRIFIVQKQSTGDGGVYLNYYDNEKKDCAIYAEQPVDGSTLEVVGTEVTFTVADTAEEEAGESKTLDYVEVCELEA